MFTRNKYMKLHKCHLRQDDTFSDDRSGMLRRSPEGGNEIDKVTNLVVTMQRVLDQDRGQKPYSPSDNGSRTQPSNGESNRNVLRRLNSGEEPYSEVCEGLYVGGWPNSMTTLPPGNPAIIDCTCEFPKLKEFEGHSYLCVPTWDTRSPQPGEIESAVKWGSRKRAQNRPVFVHCAYGHGRSVAVACALLVALSIVEDWREAEKLIKKRRPNIQMNALHRKALEEWSKHRLSTPRREK
ncbi:TYR PHOSPHATASE 2 domain-containing protein [Citrus sinensis]|uniref:TYR PHOSPHATASE 2 domain-containing protein n=1 Tax=Citrus sinensis TaxID=2711 RepID=A0ACB8L756_CITSI|nr:TYR PHOSPHATASE 2 domain-containing protein [Citrus sinensis]